MSFGRVTSALAPLRTKTVGKKPYLQVWPDIRTWNLPGRPENFADPSQSSKLSFIESVFLNQCHPSLPKLTLGAQGKAWTPERHSYVVYLGNILERMVSEKITCEHVSFCFSRHSPFRISESRHAKPIAGFRLSFLNDHLRRGTVGNNFLFEGWDSLAQPAGDLRWCV